VVVAARRRRAREPQPPLVRRRRARAQEQAQGQARPPVSVQALPMSTWHAPARHVPALRQPPWTTACQRMREPRPVPQELLLQRLEQVWEREQPPRVWEQGQLRRAARAWPPWAELPAASPALESAPMPVLPEWPMPQPAWR